MRAMTLIFNAVNELMHSFCLTRMREVNVGDSKALLVCQNEQITAVGHKCTHYGAPLVKGALGDGRVRCPWHGACFNVKTGDIEDYPGLDSIPCFKVRQLICCCIYMHLSVYWYTVH